MSPSTGERAPREGWVPSRKALAARFDASVEGRRRKSMAIAAAASAIRGHTAGDGGKGGRGRRGDTASESGGRGGGRHVRVGLVCAWPVERRLLSGA